jgi:hypothetical protein
MIKKYVDLISVISLCGQSSDLLFGTINFGRSNTYFIAE